MKIIIAGFPKTGTKTMNAALTELGYTVYDFPEHFWYAKDTWTKLLTFNGSLKDLKKAYEDVDVVCDMPACFFWDDFLEVFPNAKIILTRRENEEVWWKSMRGQIAAHNGNWVLKACYILSVTGYKFASFQNLIGPAVFGNRSAYGVLEPHWLDERRAKQTYCRHNAYVMQVLMKERGVTLVERFTIENYRFEQCAPKKQLLAFNVKEGWEPLCSFLGKSVPNIPFPHKNIRGTSVEEMMKKHPIFRQIEKELKITIPLLIFAFAIVLYLLI